MGLSYDDDYSNYLDPFDVDHNPFNMLSMTEFYIYLLVAFAGICFLFLAGYYQFRGKNNDMFWFWIIGIIALGVSLVNISAIKLSETNFVVIAVLMLVHYIVCYLIVEGSTRHFTLKHEKRIKKQNDLIEAERIDKIMNNLRS